MNEILRWQSPSIPPTTAELGRNAAVLLNRPFSQDVWPRSGRELVHLIGLINTQLQFLGKTYHSLSDLVISEQNELREIRGQLARRIIGAIAREEQIEVSAQLHDVEPIEGDGDFIPIITFTMREDIESAEGLIPDETVHIALATVYPREVFESSSGIAPLAQLLTEGNIQAWNDALAETEFEELEAPYTPAYLESFRNFKPQDTDYILARATNIQRQLERAESDKTKQMLNEELDAMAIGFLRMRQASIAPVSINVTIAVSPLFEDHPLHPFSGNAIIVEAQSPTGEKIAIHSSLDRLAGALGFRTTGDSLDIVELIGQQYVSAEESAQQTFQRKIDELNRIGAPLHGNLFSSRDPGLWTVLEVQFKRLRQIYPNLTRGF